MRLSILIVFFTIHFLGYSQKKVCVLDAVSQKPIPYATIKFEGIEEGTYTDENGFFVLPNHINSIEVSCIGFYDKKVNMVSDTVLLKQQMVELDEVLIGTKKQEIYGKHKSKLHIGFTSNSKSVFFAKKIHFEDDVFITKAHFDILNSYKQLKYRFLIFEVDNKQMPGKNILLKNIVSEINPNAKTVVLDLYSRELFLKKGTYFIAIELFEIKDSGVNPPLKIGCYKTKDQNESLYKPVFNENKKWESLKTINGKKEYAFNFYLTIQRV